MRPIVRIYTTICLNMDLLCTESIVAHSEQSSYKCDEQTPVSQKITRPYNVICNCISSSLSRSRNSFSTDSKRKSSADVRANYNPVVSLNIPIECNINNLVYVCDVCVKQTKPSSNRQVYQFSTHQLKPSVNLTCTAITNKTESVSDKHFQNVNSHIVVKDPIFRSDRCLENALKSEKKHENNVETYFKTVQKEITPPMRKIVAEWMMEVCAEEKCQEEVVLLAINYMDRFLSMKSVRKTQLQTLAASCLLLASKLREPSCRALSAELLVFYTDNSIFKDDLIKWELYVLSRLGWNLSSLTPLDFLELLIVRLPKRDTHSSHFNINKVCQHAHAFISMAAKDHQFAKFTASTIAASSIVAAISGLKWHLCSDYNIHYLLSLLTDLTSVGQELLQQCMKQMEDIFENHSHMHQPIFLDVEKPKSKMDLRMDDNINEMKSQISHFCPSSQRLVNFGQTRKRIYRKDSF